MSILEEFNQIASIKNKIKDIEDKKKKLTINGLNEDELNNINDYYNAINNVRFFKIVTSVIIILSFVFFIMSFVVQLDSVKELYRVFAFFLGILIPIFYIQTKKMPSEDNRIRFEKYNWKVILATIEELQENKKKLDKEVGHLEREVRIIKKELATDSKLSELYEHYRMFNSEEKKCFQEIFNSLPETNIEERMEMRLQKNVFVVNE